MWNKISIYIKSLFSTRARPYDRVTLHPVNNATQTYFGSRTLNIDNTIYNQPLILGEEHGVTLNTPIDTPYLHQDSLRVTQGQPLTSAQLAIRENGDINFSDNLYGIDEISYNVNWDYIAALINKRNIIKKETVVDKRKLKRKSSPS